MQYLHRVVAAGILVCVTLVMSANAQVPTTFSYQGMLCDMAGNAVPDGVHSVALSLYDVPTGGAPLWSEAQMVTTIGGVFTVLPGSVTPITIACDRPLYLGISIDEGTQLVPRTLLTAVPYARVAAEALTARSLAPGASGVVTAVNAVQGAVQIEGRAPITVTRSGNVLSIGSTGGSGGITGVQNTDGMLVVTNGNGPVATVNVADNALTRGKIAANQLVKSLVVGGVALTDHVTLAAGSNVTLSAAGSTVTIAASGSTGVASLRSPKATIAVENPTGPEARIDLADGAVTAPKIADGQVVRKLAVAGVDLSDNIALHAGANISLVPSGNELTIAATSTGLTLPYKATINADVPLLDLSGSFPSGLKITNTRTAGEGGGALMATTYAENTQVVYGENMAASRGYGVVGLTNARTDGAGVYGLASNTTATGMISGVMGANSTPRGVGVLALTSAPGTAAVFATSTATTGLGYGVDATINGSGYAVRATSRSTTLPGGGLYASSANANAVGLVGINTATSGPAIGVAGQSMSPNGHAAYFVGRAYVSDNLGIGTTAPTTTLHVKGKAASDTHVFLESASWTSGSYVTTTFGDGNHFLRVQHGAGTRFQDVDKFSFTGASVGIGTEVFPSYLLQVNGTAGKPGGGSWSNASDIRLKDVAGAYERGLSDILRLRSIRFHYKPGNARKLPTVAEEYGFVAQEVREVFPECVSTGADGFLDFNMHAINVAMVNAVQELHAKVQRQEAVIEALQSELAALRTMVQRMQQTDVQTTAHRK